MTKREEITAWDRTIRQWAWYEKHPLAKKEEYFEKHHIMEPFAQCFLCVLYFPKSCRGCPLFEQELECLGDKDPYYLWNVALLTDNEVLYSEQARIIKEAVMKWKEDHR